MQEYLVDTILIVAILVSGGVLLWLLDYAEEKGEYLVEALILPKPVLVVHNSQHAENQKSLVNKMIGRIRALDTEATPKKSKKDRKANDIEYSGQVHFPKKVYEGDSKNILINLQSSYELVANKDNAIQTQESKEGLSLNLSVPWRNDAEEYLEFELMTAGITIEGNKKQRQSLNTNILRYQWNCYFQNSGSHAFLIVIRAINSRGVVQIGHIESTIKVVKLGHLTQRQVWVWTTCVGCISGILTIAEVLHQLNIW